MDNFGVLMTCPMFPYLEQQLDRRFNLFRLWDFPSKSDFLLNHSDSIRAVVGDTKVGADSELIEALPRLEVVSSYSVGLDRIDLGKCEERGIRVTNTPDVLTEDVADAAIALILAVLRNVCVADGFVRSGKWRSGDFELGSKVCYFTSSSYRDSSKKDYICLGARSLHE